MLPVGECNAAVDLPSGPNVSLDVSVFCILLLLAGGECKVWELLALAMLDILSTGEGCMCPICGVFFGVLTNRRV